MKLQSPRLFHARLQNSDAMFSSITFSQVGRPRPNFVALCWPDGEIAWDQNTGLAVCSKNALNPAEGRKSFPSGENTHQCFTCCLLLVSSPYHFLLSHVAQLVLQVHHVPALCLFDRRRQLTGSSEHLRLHHRRLWPEMRPPTSCFMSSLSLLRRSHLMEHIRLGVCDILAAGKAAVV